MTVQVGKLSTLVVVTHAGLTSTLPASLRRLNRQAGRSLLMLDLISYVSHLHSPAELTLAAAQVSGLTSTSAPLHYRQQGYGGRMHSGGYQEADDAYGDDGGSSPQPTGSGMKQARRGGGGQSRYDEADQQQREQPRDNIHPLYQWDNCQYVDQEHYSINGERPGTAVWSGSSSCQQCIRRQGRGSSRGHSGHCDWRVLHLAEDMIMTDAGSVVADDWHSRSTWSIMCACHASQSLTLCCQLYNSSRHLCRFNRA